MDRENFQIEVADYIYRKLKEKGKTLYLPAFSRAIKNDLQEEMPEGAENLIVGYVRRAGEILTELGLVIINGNSITLTANEFIESKPSSVRDLLKKQKEKKYIDDNSNRINIYISISGLILAFIGAIFPLLNIQEDTTKIVGWLFVGIAIGYFISELTNKRIWKK